MDYWNYCGSCANIWYNYPNIKMNFDLLNWWGTFINFLIFAYIAITIADTSCFDIFQMSLSLLGLIASITINIVSILWQQKLKWQN